MANLRFLTFALLPLFLLQLYPVLVLSEPYVFPDKYYINCGSDSSETQLGVRKFVGDENPNSFSVARGKPITDTTQQSSSGSVLYQTARFSSDPFSYELDDISDKGLHVLRLHFYPFAHLGDALFSVTASSKSLLSNFSVRNSTSFPVIKDFLVPISSSKFKIYFNPANQSLAFVNAIEVFLVPNLKDNRTHLSPAGSMGLYQGLPSQLLRTVHRVAFGSQPQSISDPTAVASEWVADSDYMVVGNWATNCSYQQTVRLLYDDEFLQGNEIYNAASQNFIPDGVYKTCKEVSLSGNQLNSLNITWHFNVSKNAQHFVRVHFCDILSTSANTVQFGLFIYNNFSQQINPYVYTTNLAAPFYLDFVVDSDESDFISVGVVAWVKSTVDHFAYLNGLEIMEFITEPALEPQISGTKKNTSVYIIVGSVAGFVVICFTLLVAFLLFKKRRKAKALEPMASYGTLPFGGASPYIGISSKSSNPPPLQQTAVQREPHEDSAIDSSFNMSSIPFQRLPSNNYPVEKGDVPMEKDDGSDTTESGVFSQLRIDGGR
ncbi:hypothetical protein V6N13_044727 [Hibiscus sabdariffa]